MRSPKKRSTIDNFNMSVLDLFRMDNQQPPPGSSAATPFDLSPSPNPYHPNLILDQNDEASLAITSNDFTTLYNIGVNNYKEEQKNAVTRNKLLQHIENSVTRLDSRIITKLRKGKKIPSNFGRNVKGNGGRRN